MRESLCIEETVPSNDELYTIVTNHTSRGGKGTIIAIIKAYVCRHSYRGSYAYWREQDTYDRYVKFHADHSQMLFSKCHTDYWPLSYTETCLWRF